MRTRRFFYAFIAAVLAASVHAQQIEPSSRITVAPPVSQNMTEDGKWIPLFVQGQLTADLQNYSSLSVIDRTAAKNLTAEQSRMEAAAEVSGDSGNIQYAELVAADYAVSVSILRKGGDYSLDCKVISVKTSQPVGKAYTNSSVSERSLSDGSAVHEAAYWLLLGLGFPEKELAALRPDSGNSFGAARLAEAAAQASIARGIVAEQSGSAVEALTYYVRARKSDRNLTEATSRMEGMSAAIAGGNFGSHAKNLMKLRNDWDALLREAAEFIASNPPEFRFMYFSDIEAEELSPENYENKTMSFTVSSPYMKQTNGSENARLAADLKVALEGIPESKNWGNKINGFPWSYADDISGNNWMQKAGNESNDYHDHYNSLLNSGRIESYSFAVSLLDANKKTIAKKNIRFDVRYDRIYKGFYIVSDEDNSPSFTFKDVPVSSADTDKLYIAVEQTSGREVSILPVPEDVMSYRTYKKYMEAKIPFPRNLKLGGVFKSITFYDLFYDLPNELITLDLSETTVFGSEKMGIRFVAIKYYLEKLVLPSECTRFEGRLMYDAYYYTMEIIIPDSILFFDCLGDYSRILFNYEGTENQFKAIRSNVSQNFYQRSSATINYNYTEPQTEIKIAGDISGKVDAVCSEIKDKLTIVEKDSDVCVLNGQILYPSNVWLSKKGVVKAALKYLEKHDYLCSVDFSQAKGLAVLDENFLSGCATMKEISLPAGISKIKKNAFEGCQSLKTVYFEGSEEEWKKISIDKKGNKSFLKAKVVFKQK